ncbi:hypothetical protein [Ideonella sp. YS5]|uniref:hypothetical protein n=1 Tax=Ideonella sp. YS5 TaxID=3453714 RepID=UPI003EEEC6DE
MRSPFAGLLRPAFAPAIALWLAAATTGSALAAEEGITASGRRYAIGGISNEEQATLNSKRGDYSLWIVTAAKGSGAWLADVQVRIEDERQQVVFDKALAGPWLMIDLPLGRYEVQARRNGESQRNTTTIHRGDHHQVFFYFTVDADVLPERPGPLPSAPSGR